MYFLKYSSIFNPTFERFCFLHNSSAKAEDKNVERLRSTLSVQTVMPAKQLSQAGIQISASLQDSVTSGFQWTLGLNDEENKAVRLQFYYKQVTPPRSAVFYLVSANLVLIASFL